MGACGNGEPFRHVLFANSPEMFNTVVPLDDARSSGYITEDISYHIVFDNEKRNATITINNLMVTPDGERMIATFDDVAWTYESGSHEKRRIIKADVLTTSGGPSAPVTLTDVTILYIESNDMNQVNTAGFYASYTVDDIYRMTSYPYAVCADGTTMVTSDGRSVDSGIYYDPVYIVRFDPLSQGASVSAYGVTLGGEVYDFRITGLELILTAEGYKLSMDQSAAVEAIGESGIADISGFMAEARLCDGLDMTFTAVTDAGRYDVKCFLASDLSMVKP